MTDLRTQREQGAFFSANRRPQRSQRSLGMSSETWNGFPLIACCRPRAISENFGPSELEYSTSRTGARPS
jgi:hypothetical protein